MITINIPVHKNAVKCDHFGALRYKVEKGQVPKYIWWQCPGCLYEIAIPEGTAPDCNTTGPTSESTSSPAPPSQNHLAAVSADVQAPLLGHENVEVEVAQEKDGSNSSSDEKTEADHQIVIGHDHDDEIHQIDDTEPDLARDDPIQEERDANGKANINSRSIVLFDTSVPTSKSQRNEYDFMDVGQSNEHLDCKAINPFDGQLVDHPSNGGNLSSLPRRKPRKVRLLSELLGGNGNSENRGGSIKDSPSKKIDTQINDNVGSTIDNRPERKSLMPSDLGRKPAEIDFLKVIDISDHSIVEENEFLPSNPMRGRGIPPREHSAKLRGVAHKSAVLDQETVLRSINGQKADTCRIASLREKEDCPADGSYSLLHDKMKQVGDLDMVMRPSNDGRENGEHEKGIFRSDDIMAKNDQYERRAESMPFLQDQKQPSSSRSRGKQDHPLPAADHGASIIIPMGANHVVPINGRQYPGNFLDDRRKVFNREFAPYPLSSSSSSSSSMIFEYAAAAAIPQSSQPAQEVSSSILTPTSDMEADQQNKILEINNNSELMIRDKVDRAYMSSYLTNNYKPFISKSFSHTNSTHNEAIGRHIWSSSLTRNDHEAYSRGKKQIPQKYCQNDQYSSRNLDMGNFDLNIINVEDFSLGASPDDDQEQEKGASTQLTKKYKGMELIINPKEKGTSLDASYPNKTSIPAAMTILPHNFINAGSSSSKSFSLVDGKNLLKRPIPWYGYNQFSNFNVDGKIDINGLRASTGPAAGEIATSANLIRNSSLPGKSSECAPAFPVINPFASRLGNNSENGKRSSMGIMQGIFRPMMNDHGSLNDQYYVCTVNRNPADFTSPEPGNRYFI